MSLVFQHLENLMFHQTEICKEYPQDWWDKQVGCTKVQVRGALNSAFKQHELVLAPRTARNVPSHVSTSCPPTISWMCWVMAPRLRHWRAATAAEGWEISVFTEVTSLPRCLGREKGLCAGIEFGHHTLNGKTMMLWWVKLPNFLRILEFTQILTPRNFTPRVGLWSANPSAVKSRCGIAHRAWQFLNLVTAKHDDSPSPLDVSQPRGQRIVNDLPNEALFYVRQRSLKSQNPCPKIIILHRWFPSGLAGKIFMGRLVQQWVEDGRQQLTSISNYMTNTYIYIYVCMYHPTSLCDLINQPT